MRSGPGPDLQPPPEVAVPGAERSLVRDWRSVLLAPAGDGRRRRRGTDGMRLAAAVLALVCCLLIIHYDSRIDRAIVAVIHPPPWSITWLVTVVYQAGSFGVVIVLVGLALLARRWEIARDIGLSAVGAAAVTGLLILWLGSHGGRPGGVVIGDYDLSFPVLRIALFAAVATAALPYLARGLQVISRDLHRPGRAGLGGRGSRAAAQRRWEPGHRLGHDRGGQARLRLAAGPAVRR